MIKADAALARLAEGNERFVARAGGEATPLSGDDPLHLPQEQEPFAIVLGCSDARVPAEIVFDQGPGDLFVIRVAGNIVAPSQLGSIEFAATRFGTRLVVVLGHSRCGAVAATLAALRDPDVPASKNLQSIVNFVRPGIEALLGETADEDELMARAVRANVAASVDRVRRESDIIRKLIADDDLRVVGAEYCLQSGRVEFF